MERRRFLAGAGALTAGSLAGCSAPSQQQATTTGTGSYSVTMEPAGTVTFDSVPETWESYFPGYADMGVALGQADGLTAVGFKSRYHTDYYDELDGVSVDKAGLTELIGKNGIDKETYYELDNDVHLTDPKWLTNNDAFGLEQADVDEIEANVGPFIGNAIFRRTDDWHDYRYYTMYEAFEKVAAVFQQTDRYETIERIHDDLIATVQTDLPAAKDRPSGLLCWAGSDEPESFLPYRISDKGTNKKHFRDLGISDALAGTDVKGLSESNRSKLDYETMLEVDPDMLFVRGHETKSRSEFEDTVVSLMQDHRTGSELTAVTNGDVYRGGPIYQGPIQNLFLTERFAKLVYPDTYSGELFDRSAVSAAITTAAKTTTAET